MKPQLLITMNIEKMLGGEEPEMKPAGKAVSLPMPDGMEMPEGVEPGGTFEVMATVRVGDDGMLAVEALDGMPLPGMEPKEEAEEEPMEKETPEEDAEEGFLGAVEKRLAKQ